jgi:hypothetical protein
LTVVVDVQPKPAVSKSPTRIGNMGHLTRLANRINQASNSEPTIQGHLQVGGVPSQWVWLGCMHAIRKRGLTCAAGQSEVERMGVESFASTEHDRERVSVVVWVCGVGGNSRWQLAAHVG